MLICILKTVIGFIILMIVGTNLIGLIFRSKKSSKPNIENLDENISDLIQKEYKKDSIANNGITIFSILVSFGYLFALFYYWNIWLSLAGLLIIVFRIPDLLWEIKNNQKVTLKNRPKGIFYSIVGTLIWGIIVLVWYALCVAQTK